MKKMTKSLFALACVIGAFYGSDIWAACGPSCGQNLSVGCSAGTCCISCGWASSTVSCCPPGTTANASTSAFGAEGRCECKKVE